MYKKVILDNGVRVVLERMSSLRSVALGVWATVGSRYEGKGEEGHSHFIEHMMFKGTKLIVVDPRRIGMVQYADYWLRSNLGTDVAWINAMMHVIIKEGLHDREFIENRTVGFDELKQTVEKFTPETYQAKKRNTFFLITRHT